MCLIVAQPTIALAQKTKLPNNLNMQVGLNHSRIIFDSLTTEGVVMPYFGLNIAKNLTPKMQLIFGGQLSFRAGEQIIPRNKRYRNTHFDLQVLGQYQPSADLVLLAGVQATQLLKSQVGSPDTSGRIFLPSTGFAPNTLETLVGIGLQVQKNARMQLLYTLPIRAKAQYTNLQLGLIVNTNVLLAKKENTRKTAASKQINEFKNSVLLVCLHPKDTLNQAIIRNFEVAYNFTPVYYFFSQNTAQITQTQTEKIVFNAQNEQVILPKNQPFFITEFAQAQADTSKTIDSYTVEKRNGSLQKLPNYYGAGITDVVGWVIFDRRYQQLQEPFPYFARVVRGSSKNVLQAISSLNQQLLFYYQNQ